MADGQIVQLDRWNITTELLTPYRPTGGGGGGGGGGAAAERSSGGGGYGVYGGGGGGTGSGTDESSFGAEEPSSAFYISTASPASASAGGGGGGVATSNAAAAHANFIQRQVRRGKSAVKASATIIPFDLCIFNVYHSSSLMNPSYYSPLQISPMLHPTPSPFHAVHVRPSSVFVQQFFRLRRLASSCRRRRRSRRSRPATTATTTADRPTATAATFRRRQHFFGVVDAGIRRRSAFDADHNRQRHFRRQWRHAIQRHHLVNALLRWRSHPTAAGRH